MKILLVEDDRSIGSFVSRGMRAKGHAIEVKEDGEQGLKAARSVDWDAIILDINLPKFTGQEVCKLLRQEGNLTPIMMLTAMDSSDYIIESLRDGADDYMTKPFNFEELLVRLEGFERRSKRFEEITNSGIVTFEDVTFDKGSLVVTVGGKQLSMTSLEYSLLGYFMDNIGVVVSREDILQNVWGITTDPMTNVVDVYVSRLRALLDEGRSTKLIVTIRGRGYRFGFKADG